METTLCEMRTCEFPLKLVHTLANPGWSDDLSQYFSECTGQEALGGRDMELVEEMGGDF